MGSPYYATKVAWHALTLAVPAVAALVTVGGAAMLRLPAVRRLDRIPLIRAALVAAAVGLPLAALAGREFATSNSLNLALSPSDTGMPALPIATATDARLLHGHGEVLVWRLDPHVDPFYDPDLLTTRLLRLNGFTMAPTADGRLGPNQVCTWLRTHPDTIRVTGPSPYIGRVELERIGCPAAVVRPSDWIVIHTTPQWWIGTQWANENPTAEDAQRAHLAPADSTPTPGRHLEPAAPRASSIGLSLSAYSSLASCCPVGRRPPDPAVKVALSAAVIASDAAVPATAATGMAGIARARWPRS